MYLPVMLASPLPANFLGDTTPRKKQIFYPNEWAAEEKFDGHRLETFIGFGSNSLLDTAGVTAYSRLANKRELPTHIIEGLADFPKCILDGELLAPGKRSYGVTEIVNSPDLVYHVFDVLVIGGVEIMGYSYDERREYLQRIFKSVPYSSPIQLASSTHINTWDEAVALRDAVWARDGEGLILKHRASPYMLGKRSKHWIKLKDLKSAVLNVVEFLPSRGLINDRGPCAITVLEDEDGNRTSVTTKNNATCAELERLMKVGERHPYIGRALRIEFQERTPDGNYRHPRWDRWESE
jgi:ATP-dependent DNA ligase